MGTKNWLTVDEVAQVLGVSPVTIYRWIHLGMIEARVVSQPDRRRPTYRISRRVAMSAKEKKQDGLPIGFLA